MSKIILIVVFGWVFITAITKNKTVSAWQSFFLVLLLIFVIAFRDDSMADYKEYVRLYETGAETLEPFHVFLIYCLNYIGYGPVSYFFIIGLTTVLLQWYAIKSMVPNLWSLAILTWLGSSFILNDMVTIRAGLAAALLLLLIKYKVEHNNIKSILVYIMAVTCHLSAAIFILVFFLSPQKDRSAIYISGLLGSILFPCLGISITDLLTEVGITLFDQKILVYLNNNSEANVFSLFQLLKCFIAMLLWLNIKKIRGVNRYFLLALKVYTIGCMWFFMTYKLVAVSWRISCLFWTADIVVYPFLVYIFSKRMTPSNKFIPASISLMLFVVNLSMQQYWNPS